MKIEPLDLADFNLVSLENGTPHCEKHGAMNKLTRHRDGGGIWRCVVVAGKKNECICRAGCLETRTTIITPPRQ